MEAMAVVVFSMIAYAIALFAGLVAIVSFVTWLLSRKEANGNRSIHRPMYLSHSYRDNNAVWTSRTPVLADRSASGSERRVAKLSTQKKEEEVNGNTSSQSSDGYSVSTPVNTDVQWSYSNGSVSDDNCSTTSDSSSTDSSSCSTSGE
jgi:hypothetical protein